MSEFWVVLGGLVISSAGYLAYRHPIGYARIARVFCYVVGFFWLIGVFWSLAAEQAFNILKPFVNDLPKARAVLAGYQMSAEWFFGPAITMVAAHMLTWLPSILRDNDAGDKDRK